MEGQPFFGEPLPLIFGHGKKSGIYCGARKDLTFIPGRKRVGRRDGWKEERRQERERE